MFLTSWRAALINDFFPLRSLGIEKKSFYRVGDNFHVFAFYLVLEIIKSPAGQLSGETGDRSHANA